MWVPNLCEFFCWFQNFCLNFNGSCSSLGFAKKTKKKHQSKKDHILVAKNSDGRQEDPQILYMETLSPCVVPSRQWFGCQLLLPLNFTPIMHEFSSSEPDSWGGDPFQETLNKSPRLKKQTYPTKILMDFASNAQSRRFVWALELLHSKNCVSCSQFCSPHPQVPLTHRSLPPWLCHLRSQSCCNHDTQNTSYLIVRGLKSALLMPLTPLLYRYLTVLWQRSSGSKEELGILLVGWKWLFWCKIHFRTHRIII